MKARFLFLVIFTLLLQSFQGQEDINRTRLRSKISDPAKNEPKVEIKVNREYDDDGHLVRYDSVYHAFYSNLDLGSLKHDSIFKHFNDFFSKEPSLFDQSFFKDFLEHDLYAPIDFYKHDFFRRDYDRHREMMRRLATRMDSLKNELMLSEYAPPQNKK